MRKFWIIGSLALISILAFEFQKTQAEEIPEAVSFIPDANPVRWGLSNGVNMMVEASGYSSNKANYPAKFRRLIQIDVLRYKDISLGLEFNEETILGGPGYSSDEPYNLRHRLKYLNLRHDNEEMSFSLFYKHTCDNGIDRSGGERGWDVVGLELETKNMRLGYKNDGRFGYAISFAKKVVERDPELDAIGKLALRWDIFRYKNYIPYFELGVHSIWGSEAKWDYNLELGTRINYTRAFLAPFIKYSYEHDIDRWEGMSEHFFMAGLRLETLSVKDSLGSQERFGVFPQIHMEGYYANLVGAQDFEWNGNVSLNIDFFQGEILRGFLNTNVDLLSPDRAYRPRFVTYQLEQGIGVDNEGKFLELTLCHSSRYDVNASDGFTEHSGLLGLRAGTIGMRTGHKNEGIDFTSRQKRFEFLKKIDWKVSGGSYIYTSDYDYSWNAELGARWDILRHIKKIPYLEGNLKFFLGDKVDLEYYVESGVRFHDVGDITFFGRYQHRENVDRFGGYSDDYTLAGVRLEF